MKITGKILLLGSIFIIFSSFLTSCMPITLACHYLNIPLNDDQYEGLPNYLSSVWPLPNQKLDLFCYDVLLSLHGITRGRGVGAVLGTMAIDANLLEESSPIPSRTELFIDGTKVEEGRAVGDNLVEVVIIGPKGETTRTGKATAYYISWVPKLYPGKHEAMLRIIRDTGEVLVYKWVFTITFWGKAAGLFLIGIITIISVMLSKYALKKSVISYRNIAILVGLFEAVGVVIGLYGMGTSNWLITVLLALIAGLVVGGGVTFLIRTRTTK